VNDVAHISELSTIRATQPDAIATALSERVRRPLMQNDNKLFIVAADHPARGALSVGPDTTAMANRYELLERLVTALSNPKVDGVLATPDIIDDLALLGVLDNKIVVGSLNRGGLRGASFEMDDRFTSYSVGAIADQGLDFAKTLLRINYDDAGSLETLESNAHAVDEAVSYEIPIMLEPFISRWVDGKAINDLSTEAVIRSVAIAAGLGSSSAYSWLKLPVVDNMEAVMSATTLPTLLLGGDPDEAPDEVYETWSRALTIPGVFGLTVGRTLLYPRNGDVAQAVDIAASLVHG
jgi:DhnA family fructose-bisphosphate aldolase class Ia